LSSDDVLMLSNDRACNLGGCCRCLCRYRVQETVVVSNECVVYRVRTDRGKVWKVLEFNVEIFEALKSLENDHRYGKVWKNP